MRIGIDARMMGKGFGLARYTEQLILHLLKIDRENEYVLFLRKENWNEIAATVPRVTKVLADIQWYSGQEQLQFSAIIKKQKVDLMHFPHWNIPYLYSDPFVVTIHDLIMYHYPRAEATTLGPIKFWIKDQAHRMLLKKIKKQAKHVFVTSEFTKNDIHKTLGIALEKMTVTYQAPFENEQEGNGNEPLVMNNQQIDLDVLKKYSITKSYVLYVGAAYPHKNLQRLIEAWHSFEQKQGSNYQLVLVGKENYFYTELKKYQQKNFPNAEVVFTGFVPDTELSSLYKNASLYVFPSLYEGFGLPPLEAMISGVPVLSSERTCLPEVLQDAALFFDPENTLQMEAAIQTGLTDQTIRETLKKNAKNLLKKYSWDTLAEQTLKIYSSLAPCLFREK